METTRVTQPVTVPQAVPEARRAKTVWQRVRENWMLYLFLLPGFGLLIMFTYYPTLLAFVESFFDWKPGLRNVFVGLRNYERVLTDRIFWLSWRNVLVWGFWQFTIPFVMPILVAEAIFNLRSHFSKNVFRVLILVPILVPGIVNTLLWKWMYTAPDGGINLILRAIGLGQLARPWLGLRETALPALMLMGFPWVVGTAPLIYLAGLLNIPQDILDSTRVDGCPTWRRIVFIDLPHILPQLRLFLIFGLIGTLQNLGGPLALTGGGPSNATMVPGLYLYARAFGIIREEKNFTRLGEALAVGVIMFVVIFILTYIANRYTRTSGTEYDPGES